MNDLQSTPILRPRGTSQRPSNMTPITLTSSVSSSSHISISPLSEPGTHLPKAQVIISPIDEHLAHSPNISNQQDSTLSEESFQQDSQSTELSTPQPINDNVSPMENLPSVANEILRHAKDTLQKALGFANKKGQGSSMKSRTLFTEGMKLLDQLIVPIQEASSHAHLMSSALETANQAITALQSESSLDINLLKAEIADMNSIIERKNQQIEALKAKSITQPSPSQVQSQTHPSDANIKISEFHLILDKLSNLDDTISTNHNQISGKLDKLSAQNLVSTNPATKGQQQHLVQDLHSIYSSSSSQPPAVIQLSKKTPSPPNMASKPLSPIPAPSSSPIHSVAQHPTLTIIKPRTHIRNIPLFKSEIKSILNKLICPNVIIKGTLDQQNGEIAVLCSPNSDVKVLKSTLTSIEDLSVKAKVFLRGPALSTLVIKDIPQEFSQDQIKSALLALGSKSLIMGKTYNYSRSRAYSQVIRLEKELARSLLRAPNPRIQLGNCSHPIMLFINHLRCNFCQELGHHASQCQHTTPYCSTCGRQNHSAMDCRHTNNTSQHFCVNCDQHNHDFPDHRVEPYHMASSRTCPSFCNYLDSCRELQYAELFGIPPNHPYLVQPQDQPQQFVY